MAVRLLRAGVHLKWLRQGEGHGAHTRCRAVPGEVLGTVVAFIARVCTRVINLKRKNTKLHIKVTQNQHIPFWTV